MVLSLFHGSTWSDPLCQGHCVYFATLIVSIYYSKQLGCFEKIWILRNCSEQLFYRTPPVAVSASILFYIIFSKKHCWIYCSFALHSCFILKPKITLICFHSLCHSFSFVSYVVPLVAILYHTLSFVVTRCLLFTTRCHSLYYSLSLVVICRTSRCHSLSLVVIRCHSMYHSLSLVVTRCTIRCHSLSLDIPLGCLFINDLPLTSVFNFTTFMRKIF